MVFQPILLPCWHLLPNGTLFLFCGSVHKLLLHCDIPQTNIWFLKRCIMFLKKMKWKMMKIVVSGLIQLSDIMHWAEVLPFEFIVWLRKLRAFALGHLWPPSSFLPTLTYHWFSPAFFKLQHVLKFLLCLSLITKEYKNSHAKLLSSCTSSMAYVIAHRRSCSS